MSAYFSSQLEISIKVTQQQVVAISIHTITSFKPTIKTRILTESIEMCQLFAGFINSFMKQLKILGR